MTATVATAKRGASSARRFKRRHLWLVPGLAIAIFANAQAAIYGVGIAYMILFGVAPHLPAWLPGLRRNHGLFNVLHHPLPAVAVAIVAWFGLVPPIALVGALAWLSHIVIDWALADGIRSADGSRRGWLA